MEITRTSILSGTTTTLNLDVTEAQMAEYEAGGRTIQEVFAHLSPDDREFLKSGITAEEWAATFPEDEEDEDEEVYDEDDYSLEMNLEAYMEDRAGENEGW